MNKTKIAIVGTGMVGATAAHALLFMAMPIDILLVDCVTDFCKGQALDLGDAALCVGQSVPRIVTMQEAGQADIIVIAAGKKQLPGQSRRELFTENKTVIQQIVAGLQPICKDALIMVITNPVDPLARVALKESGLAPHQLFSSGTLLDTNRLKKDIGCTINIAPEDVELYILGEHGDSQFVCFSHAMIGQIPLFECSDITKSEIERMAEKTKQAASTIIEKKGATYYGIAACIATMCKAIVYDQKRIWPLSVYDVQQDVYYSRPVVLGRAGIEQILPLSLTEQEQRLLDESIKIIKEV